MKLLVLGGFAVGMAFILIVFRFITFDNEYINDLITFGNYAVFTLSLYVALKYIYQLKKKKAHAKSAEEDWDSIGIDRNRLPFGLELAFIGGILAMFWFNTVGFYTQTFSNIAQWNKEVEYSAKEEAKRQGASAEEKKSMGKSLFSVHCISCHGVTADGMHGKAQDLRKRISKESVLHVINNGANNFKSRYPAGMPGGLINEDDAKKVAAYVAGGMGGTKPAAWSSTCSSCHNQNGEGIPFLAPNIHSYSDELLTTILKDGKTGVIGTMPGFKGRLSENQIKAIAAYIRSRGKQDGNI